MPADSSDRVERGAARIVITDPVFAERFEAVSAGVLRVLIQGSHPGWRTLSDSGSREHFDPGAETLATDLADPVNTATAMAGGFYHAGDIARGDAHGKAFVILAVGLPPSRETAASILKFVRDRTSPFKRIRRIEFADLPKTVSGKIRRVDSRRSELARDLATGTRNRDEFWEEDC